MRTKLNLPGLRLAVPAPPVDARPAPAVPHDRERPPLPSPGVPLDKRSQPKLASLDIEMRRVRADIQSFRQPGRDTLTADLSNVRSVVEAQNLRKPGLGLQYHDSADSLVGALAALDPGERHHQRAVFRVDHRADGPHHASVDIRREPGGPLTAIVVESATMGVFAHVESHAAFVQKLKAAPGLADARVVVIDAAAQKSPADCVVFSLSFASKMHKASAQVDAWHDRLATGEPIAPDSVRDTLAGGVDVVDGHKLLPAMFFKHAHSTSDLLKSRPELADEVVGRGPDGNPETLADRKERFDDLRYTEHGPKTTSTSIDYKRHALLKQAIETLGS
jgi:YopJ family protease